ncbi:MAG: radical SAM family heme chaperone HemW [Ruminococcaceae bacterium]|nr:radical SAM family heme chaperone HemW [Oscillospiraceae bacterium]
MKSLTNLGLYLHIPFCKRKCAYCDFYSAIFTKEVAENYITALKREIKQWGGKINRPIDTIYFGGGTPSLIAEYLPTILECVRSNFRVLKDTEITLEINPQDNIEDILKFAKTAGVNRLSIGAQSGDDSELATLGRTHTVSDTSHAFKTARKLGFSNISLDLMLGLPHSTTASLNKSLDFLLTLGPEHISAYILKIEPNTVFYKNEQSLVLPDEDNVCDQYLFMCDYLEKSGFSHYEISNFAKSGYESRHNLKYWNCEEYLGLGPSAHSFLDGKRFYYPRDLKGFISGNTPIPDGLGGDKNEQIMLALRLKNGVKLEKINHNKATLFAKNGLGIIENGKFSLTDNGMLVSNQIITELLEN